MRMYIQEMGSTPTLTEPSIREVEIQDPADLSYPCGRISDHRMAYILHIDGIPETHPLRYRLDMELPDGKVMEIISSPVRTSNEVVKAE